MEFSIFNIWLNKIYHLLKKKNKPSTRPTKWKKSKKNKKPTGAPYWASGSGLAPFTKGSRAFCPGISALIPIPKHQNWI